MMRMYPLSSLSCSDVIFCFRVVEKKRPTPELEVVPWCRMISPLPVHLCIIGFASWSFKCVSWIAQISVVVMICCRSAFLFEARMPCCLCWRVIGFWRRPLALMEAKVSKFLLFLLLFGIEGMFVVGCCRRVKRFCCFG